MIHILENQSADPGKALLGSMFSDRKQLFVDFLGWDLMVVEGRYEIDTFDGPDAVYIVIADQAGGHEASLRLLPTTLPHMLDSLFPALCPLGVPTGARTWESTRLCLPRRHGAARRRVLRNILISAMVDFAIARGIAAFTGILPEAFRKEVLSMGWRGEPLGPLARIDRASVGAFLVHIDPDTPLRLGWSGTYVAAGGEARA